MNFLFYLFIDFYGKSSNRCFTGNRQASQYFCVIFTLLKISSHSHISYDKRIKLLYSFHIIRWKLKFLQKKVSVIHRCFRYQHLNGYILIIKRNRTQHTDLILWMLRKSRHTECYHVKRRSHVKKHKANTDIAVNDLARINKAAMINIGSIRHIQVKRCACCGIIN